MNKLRPLYLQNNQYVVTKRAFHYERASPMNAAIGFKIENFTELRLRSQKIFRIFKNHAQFARRGFHRIGLWRRKK